MPPELRPGETTVKLRTVLAKVTERRGDSAESERILGELAAAARAAGDPAEVRIRHQLGGVLLEQGRMPEALASYRLAAEQSAAIGRPFAPYGGEARVFAGLVGYQLGRWDEALAIARADVDQAPSLPPPRWPRSSCSSGPAAATATGGRPSSSGPARSGRPRGWSRCRAPRPRSTCTATRATSTGRSPSTTPSSRR